MTEEEALIRSFIVKEKRQRLVDLLANPKRRKKVTSSLAHFRDLDPRWVVPIPTHQQHAADIERLLRGRGAGDTCYAVSESSALDGKTLPLGNALKEVVGYGMGTLLSCAPGTLAYFEGEGPSDRCILERRAT
ncbi:MAG TPA: hypothetical protein VFV75_02490 [Candidatus Polarisedimenticolaceae bacterium]|nr:hypothetical protein [Candidatus Polarisedimenticolaceae bacterium]